MSEVWKDIQGFEGLYQVSNLGRVKSLPKERIAANGYSTYMSKEKILKNLLRNNGNQKNAIIHFNTYKDEKNKWHYKTFQISRLVAEAFLNLDRNSKANICHLDGNTLNNCVDNLKITTPKEKTEIAILNGLFEIRNKKLRKKVNQYDLQGNFIKTWESEKEASIKNNICQQNISRCCKKKAPTVAGYIWKYKEGDK